jgi:flavin-dependent dehydrogenase
MRDVIVVGAGPAGSAVAKRCAEYGLNTLMLEKRKLPRHKVCGGMVMGPVAHNLIRQEFGDIPATVLSEPSSLSGYIFHVPGIGSQKLDNFTLLGWRRDLDYWMNQKAEAEGAVIWPEARVIGLRQKGLGYSVEMERDKKRQELEARFIVGADGMNSLVRRCLFPELKVRYRHVYQVGYRGESGLDRDYYHWVYPVEYSPSFMTTHQKDDFTIIGVNGAPGQVRQFMDWAKNFLAENYHLDTGQKPAWKDGCVMLNLHGELIDGSFVPAKGNALLVGDAANFFLPVSGEGIGTAIQSGLLAADSIMTASESGEQAGRAYSARLEPTISLFGTLSSGLEKIGAEMKDGGDSLPEVLQEAYGSTLRLF